MATTKTKTVDIKKTGPQGFRQLQAQNDLLQTGVSQGALDTIARIERENPYTSLYDPIANGPADFRTSLYNPDKVTGTDYWGNSTFDEETATDYQMQHLGDVRANNQPWYSKLGAGIGKGIALAGTTFLDGTVGLVYGVGDAIVEGDISKLWDNEISNGLQQVNAAMEELMPNYRTEEEQNAAWYENLGTVNFWADSFLKNLGFTVGAFYSGGAWTKGLKAVGLLKGAMGAKVTGSLLSAVNEGRIEANNNTDDWKKLQYAQLEDAYKPLLEELMAQEDTLELTSLPDGRTTYTSKKQRQIDELQQRYLSEKADIDERAKTMGLMDLTLNTVLLSLDNFNTFGKLYAGGFRRASQKQLSNMTRREAFAKGMSEAGEEILKDEANVVGKNIRREGAKYVFDKATTKGALGKGLRTGLIEGNEELAQAFISDMSGNMQSYDSPDAYYLALTDPNAERKTKDFITSAIEGFSNTYGNGDKYEEFAVGALTGLLGIPTFGKVNNASSNTYIGRGSRVGISGGIFGELSNARQMNQEGQEAVDYMNKYMSGLQDKVRHFAQSQSFTDAMDGWAEQNDAFEYKNAEDNDDFAAISRFAKVGKLEDLKEIITQDFENISDEELDKIAKFTKTKDEISEGQSLGTFDFEGSLTESGREELRQELQDKRDKILKEVGNYEESVAKVRAIANEALNEDQVNELAWLDWKLGRFNERFASIKRDNNVLFNNLSNGLLNFRDTIDEESEDGQKWLNGVNNAIDYISYLQKANSPLDLAMRAKANDKLTEFMQSEDYYDLFADNTGMMYSDYSDAISQLRDAARMSTAAQTFNERLKEYMNDPLSLVKNRQKLDKSNEQKRETRSNIDMRDRVNSSNVSDLVNAANEGDADLDELAGMFTAEDEEFLNSDEFDEANAQQNGVQTPRQKIEEAQNIIHTTQQMNETINDLAEDPTINPQALHDAQTLLNASMGVSNSEQELLDTASQAFNDPNLLYDPEDPTIQALQNDPQGLVDALNDRLANAKSIIEQAKSILSQSQEEIADMPTPEQGGQVTRTLGEELVETTGHDATERGTSENQREQQEQAATEEKENSDSARRVRAVNDIANEISNTDLSTKKDILHVLRAIDDMFDAGATNQEIVNAVQGTETYQNLFNANPQIAQSLGDYLANRRNNVAEQSSTPTVDEDADIATPETNEAVIRNNSTAEFARDINVIDTTGANYQYWKPTSGRLPIHPVKGDRTPFHKLARNSGRYTAQQLQRMESVWDYLDSHGAFDLVDSGAVKAGDTIGFMIDPALNEKAGETVILMTDSQGRVIGDVMSKNDAPFRNQVGLAAFVDRVEKEWEATSKDAPMVSKETTTVDKNMVGKVPFLDDSQPMNTLNAVHTTTNSNGTTTNMPFKIGIAMNSGSNARLTAEAGRRKSQGQSAMERTIIPPVNASVGQSYLLMPTSSDKRKYIPVPFLMSKYSEATQNTALGRAIENVLNRVPTATNNNAIGIIRDLKELLSLKEVHINVDDSGNLKMTIKPNGAEHQMTIYNGPQNAPNLVEQLKLGLQGQPFQVSRKYINDTYMGQDYNRMIGEVSQINLPIGATHTVSDWFTLKPLDSTGAQQRARSPKTTGINPNHIVEEIMIPLQDGTQMIYNPETHELTYKGQPYTANGCEIYKALGYGQHTNQNMSKGYNTPWGYFNPVTFKFEQAPNEVRRTLDVPQTPTVDTTDTSALDKKAKDNGLLGSPKRQQMWGLLSAEDKAFILSKRATRQRQLMDALDVAFKNGTFNKPITDIIGRPLNRKAEKSYTPINIEKESKWLHRVLPNLSKEGQLKIVNGLIKISESDWAYGQFKQGVITVANNAARGTVYHEAFHSVAHTLLNKGEFNTMLDAARDKYGNLDVITLEENLAEDFRKYVQREEGFTGRFVRMFRTLKHIIENLRGKETYLDSLFYRINRGKLADREQNTTDVTMNAMAPNFRGTVQEFQNMVDSLVNNPVLRMSRIGRNSAWGRLRDKWKSEGYTVKGYYNKNTGKWTVASAVKDDLSYYRVVEQHYRDKQMLGNLGQEDVNYIQERGLTLEEYNQMSEEQKEVLFKCRS